MYNSSTVYNNDLVGLKIYASILAIPITCRSAASITCACATINIGLLIVAQYILRRNNVPEFTCRKLLFSKIRIAVFVFGCRYMSGVFFFLQYILNVLTENCIIFKHQFICEQKKITGNEHGRAQYNCDFCFFF